MSIVCIDHPFRHHGGHSGYKQLGKYLDAEIIEGPSRRFYSIDLIPEETLNRYLKLHPNWYSKEALMVELGISKRIFLQSNMIFHFLYGENSFRRTGFVNRLTGHRSRLAATFHQIPAFFEQRRKMFPFVAELDAIILVSSNQRPFFDSIVKPEMVHVIPHGVDVEFFCPISHDHRQIGKFSCLTVGSNYRDIDLHLAVINNLNKSSIGSFIEFVIIGEPRLADAYSGLKNVRYLSGISDSGLLQCYQNADLLLMPLTDTTANNAVLEAMACGIPMVVTDVAGIRDYVDDSHAKLVQPHDVDAMTDETIVLLRELELRSQMGKFARQIAKERFDWNLIARQMRDVYAALSLEV